MSMRGSLNCVVALAQQTTFLLGNDRHRTVSFRRWVSDTSGDPI
jgi:hypothetical protein